jgi:hypothetical protein
MVDYRLLEKANLARWIALKTKNPYQDALADLYLMRFQASCVSPVDCPICGSVLINGKCSTPYKDNN